ncbi:MAG: DNA polymerase III subunit beta [Nocardioidaceae bacterium]|nr:DNA polymerase III subunit beta [Nocardioidaceae bacterium]
MKFRVDRDPLAESVAWAARSLPTRPSVPVLAGLLLEAGVEGDQLRLSGFDYETSARATLPADVADEGRALVSGRLLADICRSLPAHQVEITLDGQRVSLTCGSARFTLQVLPVDDYPALPVMPDTAGTVPSDIFAHAVSQAVAAAGRDDMLPLLTGVRVEISGSQISMMSTDRFRASLVELEWSPGSSDIDTHALIPARVLSDTAKSLTSGTRLGVALADPGSGDGLIGFEGEVNGGSRRTTTRLLDGEFPRVRQLFAAEPTTAVWVETAAFVESLRRVALVAERNTPIRLSFESDHVLLEAGSGDEAQATESLPVRLSGEPISIGFNPGYLLDGLGVVDASWCHLAFTQPTRPVSIAGAPEEEAEPALDFRYLLMPLRLQG